MVTYNSSQFVNQAIESVLYNDYSDFELIICDDCSTDNTWQIINSYNDTRIRKYLNNNNIGEYKNRNQILRYANGEYCVFIDGDDFLLLDGLLNAIRNMDRFVECQMGIVRPENPKYIAPISISSKMALSIEFFSDGILDSALCNNIFRTEFLKKYNLLEIYKNGDIYSRFLLADKAPVLILYHAITIWRQTNTQASKKIGIIEQFMERKHFYENYLMQIESLDLIDKQRIKRDLDKRIIRYCIQRIFSINPALISLLFKCNFSSLIYIERKRSVINFDQFDYYNLNIFNESSHSNK